jgi:hypothetical protein
MNCTAQTHAGQVFVAAASYSVPQSYLELRRGFAVMLECRLS